MSSGDYSNGLRHGYEDMANAVRDILDLDTLSDVEKLEQIGWAVAPHRRAVVHGHDATDTLSKGES